jgi:hypothetical protein
MTELTKWAKLDTWRMMKEIEAAHGSAIFTEDALLDPHLMVRQLNSALGTSLGAQDVLDMCGRGALDINAGLSGGGAYVAKAVHPANLTADGYLGNLDGDAIGFVGAARTKLLGSATVLVQTKMVADPYQSSIYLALLSADGNDGLNINCQRFDTDGGSYNGAGSLRITGCQNSDVAGAMNVIAATFSTTRFEFAVNGFEAVAETLNDTVDRPTGNPFVAAIVDLGSDKAALQSITIYDALPDTTGLSALSTVTA